MRHRADHVIVGAGIAGLWLARDLLARGRSVAMIEVGPVDSGAASPAAPSLHFPERKNNGAVQARNHLLTGNSSFWGGALIRNDAPSLAGMFDLDARADGVSRFAAAYDSVETKLRAPSLARTPIDDAGDPARLADVNVLPGRQRNLAAQVLRTIAADPRIKIFAASKLAAIDVGANRRVASMTIVDGSGSHVELVAEQFVVSAGLIDSNIVALTQLSGALGESRARVGTHLHDHWSLPIAKLRWKKGAGLDRLYPPTFRKGFIQGRRVELDAALPWGVYAGFLHVQAQYDLVEPYATIKKWMSARQEGQGWSRQARFLPPLIAHAPHMLRIGYTRVIDRRLHVADGAELTVVMDFESFPSPLNRLTIEGGQHRLYWNVRDQDVATFAALLSQGTEVLKRWTRSSGPNLEWLADGTDLDAQRDYLERHAVDAYHLGGGLAIRRDPGEGLLAPDLRFHEIRNLAVISTAVFGRPGVANPVETLLAMCEIYTKGLAG